MADRKTGRIDTDQLERFKEAARAIGAEEDEAAFRAKLAVIGRQKSKDVPAPNAERKRNAKKHDV